MIVSDNAAVYQGFSKAQKCWAHLIRKAIKLTLQDPENELYRNFADRLLEIYRRAKRIKVDGRMKDSTRVAELDDELLELCGARWFDDDTSGSETENDYRRLCNEIMRLMLAKELFVFVTEMAADGNNNAAELQQSVDAAGLIAVGIPDVDLAVADPFAMVHRLAESHHVQQVFVRHAFRYWMGRNETLDDAPTLIDAEQAYHDHQGSMRALIASLLTSDSFLYRRVSTLLE